MFLEVSPRSWCRLDPEIEPVVMSVWSTSGRCRHLSFLGEGWQSDASANMTAKARWHSRQSIKRRTRGNHHQEIKVISYCPLSVAQATHPCHLCRPFDPTDPLQKLIRALTLTAIFSSFSNSNRHSLPSSRCMIVGAPSWSMICKSKRSVAVIMLALSSMPISISSVSLIGKVQQLRMAENDACFQLRAKPRGT